MLLFRSSPRRKFLSRHRLRGWGRCSIRPASRRSIAQSGRAPSSGGGGRRFESCYSDHLSRPLPSPEIRPASPRLSYRLPAARLAPGHLADLTALHLDPEVSGFLGGVRSPVQTGAYLDANLAHWQRHGHGLWVLRIADGAFAGRAGLRYVDVEGESEMEIAYTFRRDLWGQGLATEVAQALLGIWRAWRLS